LSSIQWTATPSIITQRFGLTDAKPLETTSNEGSSSFPQNVSALMIQTPKPAPSVSEIEGKVCTKLERDGIPF
jgi:hypothetical protein